MSDLSPAAILIDSDGHPVGIALDGAVYRLQVESTVSGSVQVGNFPATQSITGSVGITNFPAVQQVSQGSSGSQMWKVDGSGVTQPISVVTLPLPSGAATEQTQLAVSSTLSQVRSKTDNIDVLLSTRLASSTFTDRINTLGQKEMSGSTPVVLASNQTPLQMQLVGTSVQNYVSDYLMSGSTYNMKVDGSTTSRVFSYNADATHDIVICEMRFIISAASFNWSGAGFGKSASGILTNGLLIDMIVNNGESIQLSNVKINEDLLRTFGELPLIESVSLTSVIVSSFRFGTGPGGTAMVLKAGTSDKVRVTVRDNLTNGDLGINYISATFYGTREA